MDVRFEFEGSEVLALLEESCGARERLLTEAQQYIAAGADLHAPDTDWDESSDRPETGAPPGLWLMNDRGVYLRSNAMITGDPATAYARGFRAEVQVGDDSIWEFIDAQTLRQLQPEDTLVVTVREQKLSLSLMRPAR